MTVEEFLAWREAKQKAEKAKAMMYKRPALKMLNYYDMRTELQDIYDGCIDVHYDVNDDDVLLEVMDGDDDAVNEFKIMFAEMEGKADQLLSQINDWRIDANVFDDCVVGLIGNRYKSLGYDELEEDYFELTDYQSNLAQTECGKRLCRRTKADLIATIGQCMGIAFAYVDLRYAYSHLAAIIEIIKDGGGEILKTIKEVERLYEQASEGYSREFDKLLKELPDKFWVE